MATKPGKENQKARGSCSRHTPLEEEFFKAHGVPVTFVGHPLLDAAPLPVTGTQDRWPAERERVVGLLPGSRDGEVVRHLPVLLETARILRERGENIRFMISVAPSVDQRFIEEMTGSHPLVSRLELVKGPVEVIFNNSALVIAASGTVTLEAAIYGTPMVIIYKVSPVSYYLGRALVRVDHVGLANLIAGKRVVPELVQSEAEPENIAGIAATMLKDSTVLERMNRELLELRGRMGGPGASVRVAGIAMEILNRLQSG